MFVEQNRSQKGKGGEKESRRALGGKKKFKWLCLSQRKRGEEKQGFFTISGSFSLREGGGKGEKSYTRKRFS